MLWLKYMKKIQSRRWSKTIYMRKEVSYEEIIPQNCLLQQFLPVIKVLLKICPMWNSGVLEMKM